MAPADDGYKCRLASNPARSSVSVRSRLCYERRMTTAAWYIVAALCEITGCFAFWAWLRLDRTALWLVPGLVALAVFATALTRVDSAFAGRAFAAYGGVYIAASVAWLWAVEGSPPDRWDVVGSAVALAGAAIILWGPRPA